MRAFYKTPESLRELAERRRCPVFIMREGLRDAAAEIERLRADLQAATEWTDSLLARFEDHYWDTFERDKSLVLVHVKAVIGGHQQQPDKT